MGTPEKNQDHPPLPPLPGEEEDEWLDEDDGYSVDPPASPWGANGGGGFGGSAPSFGGFGGGLGGYAVQTEVQIPLWQQYHLHKGGMYRLRIQWIDETGIRKEMDHLPAEATQRQLIAAYRKSGTFLIMPVDEHGNSQLPEDRPIRINIPDDHPFLRKVLGLPAPGEPTLPGAIPYSAAPAGIPQELWDLLNRQTQRHQAEMNLLRGEMAENRAEVRDRENELRKAELALTSTHTDKALDFHSKLTERQMQQAEAILKEREHAHQQAMEAERQRVAELATLRDQMHQQASKDRDNFYRAAMQQNAEALQMREMAMKEDAKRREDWLQLMLLDMKTKEAERERRAEQDRREREERWAREDRARREHNEALQRLMNLQFQVQMQGKDPFSLLLQNADKMEQLRSAFPGMFGGEQEQGFMGQLTDLARAVFAGGAPQIDFNGGNEPQPIGLIPAQDQSGNLVYLDPTTGHPAAGVAIDPQSGTPFNPQTGQPYPVQQPQHPQLPMQPPGMPPMPAAPPSYPQPAAAHPGGFDVPLHQANPDPPMQMAAGGGGAPVPQPEEADPLDEIQPLVKKKARRAIRQAVEVMTTAPQEQWFGIIAQMVQQVPETGAFLQAATIRRAVLEAGASPEMAQQIIDAVDETERNNPMAAAFTKEIPRG